MNTGGPPDANGHKPAPGDTGVPCYASRMLRAVGSFALAALLLVACSSDGAASGYGTCLTGTECGPNTGFCLVTVTPSETTGQCLPVSSKCQYFESGLREICSCIYSQANVPASTCGEGSCSATDHGAFVTLTVESC